MELIISIGALATSMNVIIIYYKFTHNKIVSASLDILVLVVLSWLFMGTMAGLSIGMISSFIFSIYLLILPPKETSDEDKFDEYLKGL